MIQDEAPYASREISNKLLNFETTILQASEIFRINKLGKGTKGHNKSCDFISSDVSSSALVSMPLAQQ